MLNRLFASFGLSSVIILITMLAQIFSVPILLTHWGAGLYGEWLTLTGLASSLSIMNFGVQSYVCNLLISSYTNHKIEEGTKLLQSALYLYVFFAGLAGLVVIGFGFLPSILNWMKISEMSNLDGRIILIIFGVLATYAIPGGLLLSLFQVTKQMPRQLMYSLFERLILLYSPMLVVVLGGQPITVAITVACLLFILIIIELRDVWQRSPFQIGLSHADRSLTLSFIKPGITFFAVSLTVLMITTGITVLLANHAGGETVALFSTTIILGNFVRTLVNQGMNVIWPEITAVGSVNDSPERLSQWYSLLVKLVTGFVLICSLFISVFGKDVLMIWTRGKIEVDPILNLLLVLYLAIQAPSLVSSVFGLALNRQNDMLKIQIGVGMITLGTGIFFIRWYGVHGAAIALIIGQALLVPSMLKFTSQWVHMIWQDFLRTIVSRLLPGYALVLLLSLVFTSVTIPIIERNYYFFIAIPLILLLFWYYWFTSSEKEILMKIVTGYFHKNVK